MGSAASSSSGLWWSCTSWQECLVRRSCLPHGDLEAKRQEEDRLQCPFEGNCSSDLTFHCDLKAYCLPTVLRARDLTFNTTRSLETASYTNHDTWGYLEKEEACHHVPCLSGKDKNAREPSSEHMSKASVCAVCEGLWSHCQLSWFHATDLWCHGVWSLLTKRLIGFSDSIGKAQHTPARTIPSILPQEVEPEWVGWLMLHDIQDTEPSPLLEGTDCLASALCLPNPHTKEAAKGDPKVRYPVMVNKELNGAFYPPVDIRFKHWIQKVQKKGKFQLLFNCIKHRVVKWVPKRGKVRRVSCHSAKASKVLPACHLCVEQWRGEGVQRKNGVDDGLGKWNG